MKQCEGCIYEPYKDKLLCCAVAHLFNACRELINSVPLFRKKRYVCNYSHYNIFPEHVNCRCSVIYPEENKK